MDGHARHHEAWGEQQRELQELGSLTVQQVLPDAVGHVFGQHHGHRLGVFVALELG
jgi:hypothetical protein